MSTYIENYGDLGLPETVRVSLLALEEHSRNLVFESRKQIVRLLIRARRLDRWTATESVRQLLREGLISIEKPKDDLQPPLVEFDAALPRSGSVGATTRKTRPDATVL